MLPAAWKVSVRDRLVLCKLYLKGAVNTKILKLSTKLVEKGSSEMERFRILTQEFIMKLGHSLGGFAKLFLMGFLRLKVLSIGNLGCDKFRLGSLQLRFHLLFCLLKDPEFPVGISDPFLGVFKSFLGVIGAGHQAVVVMFAHPVC